MTRKQSQFLPYSRQDIDEQDIKAVVDVLRSDYVTQGPIRGDLEQALSNFCHVDHVSMLSTGSAALHSACFALGVGSGDEVLVPNNTFAATANGVVHCSGKPVFVDSSPDSFHASIVDMEQKITERTVGIIPMHYGGLPCNLEEINKLARLHGLWVLEDAAHAVGASYQGQPIGNCRYGNATIFSFHPIKPLCMGEGGAVTSNDSGLIQKVREFANSGITKEIDQFEHPELSAPWYAEMHSLGFNYRITEMQCALGLSQLGRLETFINKRNELAGHYKDLLSKYDYIQMPLFDYAYEAVCAYHLFPVLIDFSRMKKSRAVVMENLREKNIGTQAHYIPLSHQIYYQKKYGYSHGDLPESEKVFEKSLSLPISVRMNEEDVFYVVENLLQELIS
ncbi:DegT/DnrJ/EryC1/StrS family aminotransferase [Acidobacteriota bacterium]